MEKFLNSIDFNLLIENLKDQDSEVREETIFRLNSFDPSQIMRLEKEDVWNVKNSIVISLGKLAPNSTVIIEPLFKCLSEDEDTFVQESACRTLLNNKHVSALLS